MVCVAYAIFIINVIFFESMNAWGSKVYERLLITCFEECTVKADGKLILYYKKTFMENRFGNKLNPGQVNLTADIKSLTIHVANANFFPNGFIVKSLPFGSFDSIYDNWLCLLLPKNAEKRTAYLNHVYHHNKHHLVLSKHKENILSLMDDNYFNMTAAIDNSWNHPMACASNGYTELGSGWYQGVRGVGPYVSWLWHKCQSSPVTNQYLCKSSGEHPGEERRAMRFFLDLVFFLSTVCIAMLISYLCWKNCCMPSMTVESAPQINTSFTQF